MAERVVLNVGGRAFETTKSTLIQSPYFEAMLNGNWPLEKDVASGAIKLFIDRSPTYFGYALDHMRGYPLRLESETVNVCCCVKAELQFFGLILPPEKTFKFRFNTDYKDTNIFELTQSELGGCYGGKFHDQLTRGEADSNGVVTLSGFDVSPKGWSLVSVGSSWFEFVVDVVKSGGKTATKMHLLQANNSKAADVQHAYKEAKKFGIAALVKAIVDATATNK